MAKSKKELDKDLMFAKIMPALSDNPFSDLHGDDDASLSGDSAADAQPQSAAAKRNARSRAIVLRTVRMEFPS